MTKLIFNIKNGREGFIMYINRALSPVLQKATSLFPAILVTGPRQSGKTTLLKTGFPDAEYVTFDNPLMREMAIQDPRGFISRFDGKQTILDEVQYVPDLFSYLKIQIDNNRNINGRWLLTGSQQFNMMNAITDSLAGRIAIISLLPLSYNEYRDQFNWDIEQILFNGSYPEIVINPAIRDLWVSSYIHTYIERDVRQIVNIKDIGLFQTFMGLCAANHGQELNAAGLSRDCGIAQPTITRWISILESSFILYLLKPYYKNLGKRLIKSPKMYFVDSSIPAFLTRQGTPESLFNGISGGSFFESFIITETYKTFTNKNINGELFFWRSHDGMEIDLLIETGGNIYPIEIKKTSTPSLKHAEPLEKFIDLAEGKNIGKSLIVCTVDEDVQLSRNIKAVNWRSYFDWLDSLMKA